MLLLEDFWISPQYGLLSSEAPLKSFCNEYYAPWDDLSSRLPDLISANKLEQAIHDLTLLDTKHLDTDLEYQRAYTILAFAVHGFVWSSSPPRELIPKQLSEPFLQVCEVIGMRPVISYAGLCIWNWQSSNMDTEPELEKLKMVTSFTGTRGEAAFYHVPVLVEYVGGHLVATLLDAIKTTEVKAVDARTKVIDALEDASRTIEQMGKELSKLFPALDADFFYHELRPWISGGRGMGDKGLPRGMVFQRSDGSEVEAKFVGGSAIQSSLFPFLDHALGVSHDDQMFTDMRQYMPGKHRDFLIQVGRLPSLRAYVVEHEDDAGLIEAYNTSIKALRTWRRKHIAVVSKYIVQPARREAEKAASSAIDRSDSPMQDADGDLQGTGGTALIPFLRKAAEDTLDA